MVSCDVSRRSAEMRPLLLGLLLWAPLLMAQMPAAVPPAEPSLVTATAVRVLLVPENEAVLSSQIAARITALPVPLGGHFKAGQTLVQFDCEEASARLHMAEAELASAHETLVNKQQLQTLRAASELDIRLARAGKARAAAQVELMRAQLRHCTLVAPFAGQVVKLRVHAHETVAPGQPLLEIIDNSRFRFQLHVPSRLLSHIKAGSRFAVTIDETGSRYPAVVKVINGRVDPVSQTVELTATIDGHYPELLAGMSGSADFDGR